MRQHAVGIAAATLVLGLSPPDAAAQESAATAASPGLADIVVTAQRRTERLQDVPVAVSAFSAADRDRIGLNAIQDIANFTPSLSYQDYPNRVSIRGIGRLTNALGSDPGVAVYVDGVYTSETSPLGQFPLFVERIEILRGPQGTLYGRNSIGGAVNTISRRPTETFTGEVRLVGGERELFQPQATLAGPIAPGLRFRVGGVWDYQGKGYVRNVGPAGGSLGTRDDYYLEAQVEADLGERSQLWVKYSTARWSRSAPIQVQTSPYLTAAYFPPNSILPNPTFGDPTPNPGVTDPRRVNLDDIGYARLRNNHSVTAHLTIDLGGAQLRYIGGWNIFDYSSLQDYDQAARASYTFAGNLIGARQTNLIENNKRTISNELTLSGDSGTLRWITGLYQYHDREEQPFQILSPNQPQLAVPLSPPAFTPAAPNPGRIAYQQRGDVRSNSYAAFAQGDLKLGDVTLTAGLRYTRDRKRGDERFRIVFFEPFTLAGIAPPLAACCSLDVTPPVSSRTLRRTFEGVTGRLAAAWQPERDTLFYGSVATGYKSGGFNLGQVAPNAVVEPERVLAFEAGAKRTVAQTLRVEAAVFYNRYSNLQSLVNVIRNSILQQDFVNARRARALGAEVEAVWTPTPQLTLTGAYSYLDAKFTRFCCAVDVASATPTLAQDLAGNRLPQAPRHKVAVNATYALDVGAGTLAASGSLAHVGSQFYAPFSTAIYRAPGYEQADLRLIFDSRARNVTVIGFVRNLFDANAINGLSLGPASAGLPRIIVPNPPRTFGAELQVRF